MNKIFRIVWSASRNAFIVAHERAKSQGKPSSTRKSTGAAALLLGMLGAPCFAQAAPPAANALPTGGQVAAGVASIAQNGAVMNITQTSQNTIINWQSFNIGAAAQVNFAQPNASAVALNRVLSSDPSAIYGKLTANGQVFLLNPNGVLFGSGSRVDVGGLVASTMKMSDADFMAGNYHFTGGNGVVINQGSLNAAQKGYIALLAPEVRNEGVISASMGTVVLGAAEAVTLSIDESGIAYAVDKGAVQALVDNKGLVQADGGQVLMSARAANTLASAVINNSGTVEAKGLIAKGGKIMLEADHITLSSGSTLDAAGETGGGTVLVGGDWQGSGDLHQATTVAMEQGAVIDTSATVQGDGGKVVLWSDVQKADSVTRVDGEIFAKGGAQGGDGGKVETSGHTLKIGDNARVRTSAAQGNNGQWLLDPTDFTIAATGGDITGAALGTALASNNITITTTATTPSCVITGGAVACTGYTQVSGGTNGNININDAVSWNINTLTLFAYGGVNLNSALTVGGSGGLAVTCNGNGYAPTSLWQPINSKYLKATQSGSAFSGKINWSSSGTLGVNNYGDGTWYYNLPTVSTTAESYSTTGDGNTVGKIITTAAELAAIPNSSAYKYVLGADITLTGTWTPITGFAGQLNGLGHTISGLNNGASTATNQGLFGSLNGAYISNLGLVNYAITGGSKSGALAGEITGGTNYILDVFTGTGNVVSAGGNNTNIGGLIGSAATGSTVNLANVTNRANVHAADGSGNTISSVGGIIGSASDNLKMYNSSNSGEIIAGDPANKTTLTLGNSVGGLVGQTTGGSTNNKYESLSNSGNVYGLSEVGGVVGYLWIPSNAPSTWTSNTLQNSGNISGGGTTVGGLIGWLRSFGYGFNLNYGANKGDVTRTAVGSGSSYLGGLIGYALLDAHDNDALNIQYSYNSGKVETLGPTGGHVGGLVGLALTKGNISTQYSYSNGNFLNATYSGGLFGKAASIGSGSLTFNEVYAVGTTDCAASTCGAYAGRVELVNNVINLNGKSWYSLTSTSSNTPYYIGSYSGTPTVNGFNPGGSIATATLSSTASLGFTSGNWSQNNAINNGYVYLSSNVPTTPVTITVNALSKTYGEASNPSLTSQYSLSGCTGCITLDWGSYLTGTTAAGIYGYSTANLLGLTYVSGSAGSYNLTWGGNSFTVNPRPINITANSSQTKTYGAANPTYTYAVEAAGSSRGLVNSDTFSGALARVAGENVGTYAINSVGTLANSNYAITVVPANFSVTQAPLTITATDATKTYGQTPTLSAYTSSALQNRETIGGVTLTSAGTAATAAVSGSPYSIVPSAATGGTFTASNYNITYTNGALSVNTAPLTIIASAQSKTYGATLALGSTAYTSSGLQNSETIGGVTLASSGAVNTAAVTTYNITPSAATGGTFATGNYNITYTDGTLTVGKAPLTVTANNASKTYDGNAYSGGNGVNYGGFVLSQDQTALGGALSYATGSSNGATNAGSYNITPSGYTASNYSFSYVNGALTVDKKTVSLSAAKTYDGNTTLGASTVTLATGISDQSLTYSGATANSKDVADNATNYITALTLVNGTGGLASNYQLPTLNVANAPVTITKKDISVTAIQIADKIYDGTTNASSVQSTTLSGVVAADLVNVNTSGTLAAFGGKDIGNYSISVTGLSLTGSAIGNYNLTGGTTATDASVAITAKPLTLTASKTYDGTTGLTGFVTLGGFVGTETLNVTSATASNSHVATANKYVSAITLADGTNGGVTTNYSLPAYSYSAGVNSLTINAATLTPTITNTGVTKVYDGSATSSFTPTYSFTGLVSGDSAAALNYTGRNYNTQDVLTANTITVSGLSITNITGGNSSATTDYVLGATNKTVAATITPKTLTVAGLAASNKTYNALTDVTITNWGSVTTVVGSETLVLTPGTASFADKNAANGKTVTAIGYSLASGTNGGLASNYSLTSTSATTTADITAKTIALTGSTGVTKTYDGLTSMPVGSNGYASLVGIVGSDTVTVAGAPVFDSANAGARTVQIGTVAIAGADASNYNLSWSNGGGTINKAPLTVTANADAKFVTQADVASFNGVSYSGFVNGENSGVLGGAQAISRTNSGTNNAGIYSGVLQPSGLTSGNYNISFANGDYTVVPAGQLLVTVQNTSATYASAPAYTISSAKYLDNGNVIQTLAAPSQSGDTFTYSDGAGGTAVFTLGPVSPQTSSAGKLKAGNYQIAASSIAETSTNFSNTLTIVGALAVNQKALTATATGVSKVYDGTTAMTNVSLGLTGLVSGDAVAINGNGNFAQKDAGSSLGYAITALTLGSTDAANYYLSGGNSLSGANGIITAKTVSLTAARTYDGTTALGNGTVAITTGVGSETLTYSGATAHSKNVGNGNYIDAITLANATDGSGGAASNYQLPSLLAAGADNSVNLAKKVLNVSSINASNKTYDGNTNAVISLSNLLGLIGSESLVLSSTSNFDSPSVGVGKNVVVKLALADGINGGLAGNYTISDANTIADIRAVPTDIPPLPPSVPPTPPPTTVPTPPEPPPTSGTPPGPSGAPAPQQLTVSAAGETPLSSGSGSSATGSGASSGFISVRSFGALEIPAGTLFSFTLPKDTFKHADARATVVLEARTADGRPLPSWLSFDPGTDRFTGTPPSGLQQLAVVVTAHDNTGGEASTKMTLRFGAPSEVQK